MSTSTSSNIFNEDRIYNIGTPTESTLAFTESNNSENRVVFSTYVNSKINNKFQKSFNFNLQSSPDIAQTIAVTCFGLGISCYLIGLQTLKIKETDRLEALKIELTKLGATISITNDSLTLEKSENIKHNVNIATYQDHRMAMAFAPLALKAPIIIENAEVVSKSYPAFWDDFKQFGFILEENEI